MSHATPRRAIVAAWSDKSGSLSNEEDLVKAGKAILAGIIGGLAMTVLAWLAGEAGIGVFLVNMGPAVVALFVIEHLIYGTIVGALYGAVLHRSARPEPALRRG